MEKVDIAIGVVGLLALVATGLGVAFYDNFAGVEEFHVVATEASLENKGPVAATNGIEQVFTWEAPQNATGAAFDVTVQVTPGTPLDSGSVNVVLRLTGPGDHREVTQTGSMDVQDGTATFTIDAEWAVAPGGFRSSDQGEHTLVWDDNITLVVVLDGPGGVLPLPGFPAPSYQVSVSGDAFTYHAVRDLPDPQATGE